MAALATSCIPVSALLAPCFPITSAKIRGLFSIKNIQRKATNQAIFTRSQPFATRKLQLRVTRKSLRLVTPIIRTSREQSASSLCLAALGTTCGATQTSPQVRKGKTKTIVSSLASFKPPQFDQSGRGHPPGGGGGGGGGGGRGESGEAGWGWWFALFCVVFLYFISTIKDNEGENSDYPEYERTKSSF